MTAYKSGIQASLKSGAATYLGTTNISDFMQSHVKHMHNGD